MGGQTSRMLREAVSDSMYIIRQTNRSAYQESVAARHELESKIEAVRTVRKEMLDKEATNSQRVNAMKHFQHITTQKKELDDVVGSCTT